MPNDIITNSFLLETEFKEIIPRLQYLPIDLVEEFELICVEINAVLFPDPDIHTSLDEINDHFLTNLVQELEKVYSDVPYDVEMEEAPLVKRIQNIGLAVIAGMEAAADPIDEVAIQMEAAADPIDEVAIQMEDDGVVADPNRALRAMVADADVVANGPGSGPGCCAPN